MPRYLLLTVCSLLFTLLALTANAQKKAMTFAEYGPERVKLDSVYQSAMHVDSTLAVFDDRQDAFMEARMEFFEDIGGYLKDRDLQWGEPTRCYTRVYFDATGQVDVFLYSFRKGTIDPAKEQRFGELLNGFLAEHGFPLNAAVPFSQCGAVIFQDAAPK